MAQIWNSWFQWYFYIAITTGDSFCWSKTYIHIHIHIYTHWFNAVFFFQRIMVLSIINYLFLGIFLRIFNSFPYKVIFVNDEQMMSGNCPRGNICIVWQFFNKLFLNEICYSFKHKTRQTVSKIQPMHYNFWNFYELSDWPFILDCSGKTSSQATTIQNPRKRSRM